MIVQADRPNLNPSATAKSSVSCQPAHGIVCVISVYVIKGLKTPKGEMWLLDTTGWGTTTKKSRLVQTLGLSIVRTVISNRHLMHMY